MEFNQLMDSFHGLKKVLDDLAQNLGDAGNKELASKTTGIADEIRKMEKELLQIQRINIIGQMVRAVVHELKNPLGVINTAAYYLRGKISGSEVAGNNPKIMKYIGMIEQQVSCADNIVRKISDFSRTTKMNLVPVRVEAVIEETLYGIEQMGILPENIEVVKNFASEMPAVNVDEEKISYAFFQIVMNALEAMPEGGRLEVTAEMKKPAKKSTPVKAGRNRNLIEICFRDEGKGISEEHVKRLVDPLFTTKPKGYGLGLTVAADIVRKHHGALAFDSSSGKGTTVRIALPCATG